ncbi:MAG: endonuclease/exonuclease/phosphatase family protein [Marivita sp.]|uniref:endonuclease/exonuclease/phosphatase family protein n=1 Tax=Marivita sp. TaxID=2003365 RepID=UPI003EF16C68
MALWHAPLSRDGPGLLLRDLEKREAELVALAEALGRADADIVVLTRFDYDAKAAALTAFAQIVDAGYDHVIALRSNAGIPTTQDMDGDGRFGEPEDAQAFGRFPGQEALAVLSRYPLDLSGVRSFNDILWRDLPGTHIQPGDPGGDVQRVSSGGHWVVPIEVGDGARQLSLLIGHAGAPVFDGPEDRNGRRNLDELRLWGQILDGLHGAPPRAPFAVMANTNLDPQRGEGYRDAMAAFLARVDLTDPLPDQITADWDDPGPMRVSYLLPSSDLRLRAASVWPAEPEQDHKLITVDIRLPDVPLP